jgi:hypothetical protein
MEYVFGYFSLGCLWSLYLLWQDRVEPGSVDFLCEIVLWPAGVMADIHRFLHRRKRAAGPQCSLCGRNHWGPCR